MARNDGIPEKHDPKDIEYCESLVSKAFSARRKIESGFIELAESIAEILRTKLYRVKCRTFAESCDEELGF
ncbi:MAG: hypothetical protein WCQ50_02630 [Spirochaetota bacterium]